MDKEQERWAIKQAKAKFSKIPKAKKVAVVATTSYPTDWRVTEAIKAEVDRIAQQRIAEEARKQAQINSLRSTARIINSYQVSLIDKIVSIALQARMIPGIANIAGINYETAMRIMLEVVLVESPEPVAVEPYRPRTRKFDLTPE